MLGNFCSAAFNVISCLSDEVLCIILSADAACLCKHESESNKISQIRPNYCLYHPDCAVFCVICSVIIFKKGLSSSWHRILIYFCCWVFFVQVVHVASMTLLWAHLSFIFFIWKQINLSDNKLRENERRITNMGKKKRKKKKKKEPVFPLIFSITLIKSNGLGAAPLSSLS